MYEVEIKVPVGGDVRDRLQAIGADQVERVHQVDDYFDAPHRDFATTDEALRIRHERVVGATVSADERVQLTYKGPKIDAASKTRTEHEVAIGDPATAQAVLEALGFDLAATVEKDRQRFQVGETHATVDDVAGLGTYLELEREVDDEAAVDAARDALEGVLADLDLDPDDQIRTSYLGLLLE